ncbi:hypothetical protein K503DRAFT_338464 [Rhizopogon vinicolor AM-OR11-026]|uniref:Uncharacterized protein n=1 Tax=Rhizopogon vinicolor AM-OR11-026 TaxID=1314800 RepID=A0A1B7MTP7_9AGAM|nr:hypothetical protein K503DRAFT_338464 [Rhizopogon vinicolor AM-OR11-026]
MRETEEHERNLGEAIRREIQEKEARRAQWATEVEEHERKLSEAIRRENQEKEARRAQWETEMEEHTCEEKKRQARFEKNMQEIRAQWQREVVQRSLQWEREEDEHNRAVEKRERREEQERLRLNILWSEPESHTCTSYGTREYTARLVNVPADYDRRVEACMAMPINIHGVEYKAKRCEDHGPSNVIGHWEVDQHEPDCASYWYHYRDHGCVSPGSGQRRIEHYLENLPSGSDWREFCATTPASFRGMHFIGAQFSFQKNGGTYGHWVFDDESCN